MMGLSSSRIEFKCPNCGATFEVHTVIDAGVFDHIMALMEQYKHDDRYYNTDIGFTFVHSELASEGIDDRLITRAIEEYRFRNGWHR